MTLTVRHHGELLAIEGSVPFDQVTAVIWFDPDEETGSWGGVIEPANRSAELRASVSLGESRYRLRINDGRQGIVELGLSEFVADDNRPVTFTGIGPFSRVTGD